MPELTLFTILVTLNSSKFNNLCISHSLLRAQKGQKKGFYSLFVVGSTIFQILVLEFWAFFVAKRTKTKIQNFSFQMIIDILAHVEWFVLVFLNFCCKTAGHAVKIIKVKIFLTFLEAPSPCPSFLTIYILKICSRPKFPLDIFGTDLQTNLDFCSYVIYVSHPFLYVKKSS